MDLSWRWQRPEVRNKRSFCLNSRLFGRALGPWREGFSISMRSDVTPGQVLFVSLPSDVEQSRSWFYGINSLFGRRRSKRRRRTRPAHIGRRSWLVASCHMTKLALGNLINHNHQVRKNLWAEHLVQGFVTRKCDWARVTQLFIINLSIIVQMCSKICGLGCVNRALVHAWFTQPRPRIFRHFCIGETIWTQIMSEAGTKTTTRSVPALEWVEEVRGDGPNGEEDPRAA